MRILTVDQLVDVLNYIKAVYPEAKDYKVVIESSCPWFRTMVTDKFSVDHDAKVILIHDETE